MESIPIIYEESHFLLVNKPAALFSQAAGEIDSLQRRLVSQLKERDGHAGEPFVGLPHRLDRGTSGIMLIARNQRALKRFGEQFQSRKVVKHYLAVVEGEMECATQRWDDYVRKIPDQPQAEVVNAEIEGAKRALATASCWVHAAGQSLLLVQLETGRMHQIRVQAASRGFPVVGDAAYGAQESFKLSGSGLAVSSPPHSHPPIALHALALSFRHPQSAKPMTFAAAVPQYWDALPSALYVRAQQAPRTFV